MKKALVVGALTCSVVLLTGCYRTGGLVWHAPVKMTSMKNPMEGNAEAWRAGAKLFSQECSPCHGANREGTPQAPSLKQPEVSQAAPGRLFWVLRNGSLPTGMPSFASLPEQQRWQIITFLRQDHTGPIRSQ
jgi:mono/diheme cytochrome c family protein